MKGNVIFYFNSLIFEKYMIKLTCQKVLTFLRKPKYKLPQVFVNYVHKVAANLLKFNIILVRINFDEQRKTF